MPGKPLNHLNIVIDDLTNSIRAIADGSVHETEISLATIKIMGYIKEPKNVDLVVGPSVLTDEDKKQSAKRLLNIVKPAKPQL